jgi:hypothetical protein
VMHALDTEQEHGSASGKRGGVSMWTSEIGSLVSVSKYLCNLDLHKQQSKYLLDLIFTKSFLFLERLRLGVAGDLLLSVLWT